MALLSQSEALQIINEYRQKPISRQAISKLKKRGQWNFFRGSSDVDISKLEFWEYATGASKPSKLLDNPQQQKEQESKAWKAKRHYERDKGIDSKFEAAELHDEHLTHAIEVPQEARPYKVPETAYDTLSPKDLGIVLKNEKTRLEIAAKQQEVILKSLIEQLLGAIDNAFTMNFIYLGQRVSAEIASKLGIVGMEQDIEGIINSEVQTGIQEVKRHCRLKL